jgi:hypothetical protein
MPRLGEPVSPAMVIHRLKQVGDPGHAVEQDRRAPPGFGEPTKHPAFWFHQYAEQQD